MAIKVSPEEYEILKLAVEWYGEPCTHIFGFEVGKDEDGTPFVSVDYADFDMGRNDRFNETYTVKEGSLVWKCAEELGKVDI